MIAQSNAVGADVTPRDFGKRDGALDTAIGTGSAWVTLIQLGTPVAGVPLHFAYEVEGKFAGATPIVVASRGWGYFDGMATALGEEVVTFASARIRLATGPGGFGLVVQAQQHATEDWRFLVRLRESGTQF